MEAIAAQLVISIILIQVAIHIVFLIHILLVILLTHSTHMPTHHHDIRLDFNFNQYHLFAIKGHQHYLTLKIPYRLQVYFVDHFYFDYNTPN